MPRYGILLDDDGATGFVVGLGSGEDVPVRDMGLGRAGATASFRGAFTLALSASFSAFRLGAEGGGARSAVPFVRTDWAAGPVVEDVLVGAGGRDCDGACD